MFGRVFVTGASGFLGRHLVEELRRRGVAVRALVRSDVSADALRAAGAEPVRGDLDDISALDAGAAGCDVVFHTAAIVADWGDRARFHAVHVRGTEHLLDAAARAGVPRFVHVSTEAVLAGPAPIVNATEDMPRPAKPYGPYALTKGLAEARVLAANRDGFATIIVRPRFIWGKGDTSVLPKVVAAVRSGRYRWIEGGHYLSSTTHVRNAVEGLMLAAEHGRPGATYFITDGPPMEFRAFLTRLLATQDVHPTDRSLSRARAWRLARIVEGVWQLLRLSSPPPVSRMTVKMLGEEVTLDDSRARRELGYVGHVTVEDGLRDMRERT